MKILHTADWHLGKRLDQASRLPEQAEVLQEICQIADQEEVDVVVVAGDLFDTFNPSSEAMELLYSSLHQLANHGKRLVLAIAGNHDSPERIDAPDALARVSGIVFVGRPGETIRPLELPTGLKITHTAPGFLEAWLPSHPFPLRVAHTPYANEARIRQAIHLNDSSEDALRDYLQQHWQEIADTYLDSKGFNLLVTHLFFQKEGEPTEDEPADEKPILHVGGAQAIYSRNIPAAYHYVALGHLHRPHSVDTHPCDIRYAGSPLSYSFAEANQQKSVELLTVAPGGVLERRSIPLKKGKPLLRHRFQTLEEGIAWLQDHTNAWVELTWVTDTFLESSDKEQLYAAHEGIIQVIPEIKRTENVAQAIPTLDLSQDMATLFDQYFTSKHQTPPNESIRQLFKEILSQ